MYFTQSYSIIVPYILLYRIHPMLRRNFSVGQLLKYQNNKLYLVHVSRNTAVQEIIFVTGTQINVGASIKRRAPD